VFLGSTGIASRQYAAYNGTSHRQWDSGPWRLHAFNTLQNPKADCLAAVWFALQHPPIYGGSVVLVEMRLSPFKLLSKKARDTHT